MPLKKIRKLFIQTAFLLVFFFLFSLAFFSRSINACAPGQSCGQCGGNACTQPTAGQNCTSLGNTYDCSPCYSCSPAPVAPPPSQGSNCGSIGGNACSWAAPNAQPPATCVSLGNTYDFLLV